MIKDRITPPFEATYGEGEISRYSEKMGEPEWMRSLRLEAFSKISSLPLPDVGKRKVDTWNFSRFLPFVKGERGRIEENLPSDLARLIREEDENLLIQENGSTLYHRISPKLKEQGVLFMSLEEALIEHSDLVRRYFMKAGVSEGDDRLTALHASLWSGGIFLYVPANVMIEEPLLALFNLTGEGVGMVPHVILVAEENSLIRYVESRISEGGSAVHNGITELYVGPGAKIQFAGVYRFGEGTVDYHKKVARVERDGQVEWNLGEMGRGNSLSENVTFLLGNGSSARSQLIGIGTGEQQGHFISRVIHHGKNTESDILEKGVLLDHATQVYSGITKIEKGATKANGEQTERLMMLSKGSRGDAHPILLIDEDDVKCGHAASVGRMDETQLYYLMSRGISRKEAERLIIHGFLNPVVEGIPLPRVRQMLKEAIEGKLGG